MAFYIYVFFKNSVNDFSTLLVMFLCEINQFVISINIIIKTIKT